MTGLLVPAPVATALLEGADLAVSISGGKDGQAALALCSQMRSCKPWPGRFIALHADLGRFEWRETSQVVEQQAARYGAALIVVRRVGGDLLWAIEREEARLAGTGRMFWPSRRGRYCTSEQKRGPLTKAQRHLNLLTISVQGLRAEESPGRARTPSLVVEKRASAKRLSVMAPAEAVAERRPHERLVLNWLAVHHLSEEQVWQSCGTSRADLVHRRTLLQAETGGVRPPQPAASPALVGWPCHPAYVYGNGRVSCALCVLAGIPDLENGIRHEPGLALEVAAIEARTGQTFRPDFSVTEALQRGCA